MLVSWGAMRCCLLTLVARLIPGARVVPHHLTVVVPAGGHFCQVITVHLHHGTDHVSAPPARPCERVLARRHFGHVGGTQVVVHALQVRG
jgi:hypothetical protein